MPLNLKRHPRTTLPRHLPIRMIVILSLGSFLGLCVGHGSAGVSSCRFPRGTRPARKEHSSSTRSGLGTAALLWVEGPTPSPFEGCSLHYSFVPAYTVHKIFPTSDDGPEFKKCFQHPCTYLNTYNGNKTFTKQHLPLCTMHPGVFFSILFLVTLFKSWSRSRKLVSWLSDGSQPASQKTLPSANSPGIPYPLSRVALPLSW